MDLGIICGYMYVLGTMPSKWCMIFAPTITVVSNFAKHMKLSGEHWPHVTGDLMTFPIKGPSLLFFVTSYNKLCDCMTRPPPKCIQYGLGYMCMQTSLLDVHLV